jgi:pyruvate,water dikinase
MPSTAVTPRNFPVTWDHPEDADRYWITDLQHNAYPQVPLTKRLLDAFPRGMGQAFVGLPPGPPPRRLTFNGYVYTEVRVPTRPTISTKDTPSGAPPAIRDYEPDTPPPVFWEETIRPRVEAITAPLKLFPVDEASLPDLVRHVIDLEGPIERLGTLHHQAVMPAGAAARRFSAFCERHGIGAAEQEDLLHGVEQLSLVSSRQQWELGRLAAAGPLVLAVLQESRAAEIEGRLRALGAPAAPLIAGVEAHLRQFGWRPAGLHPFGPAVIDDPTPVWEAVRAAATGAMTGPAIRHAIVARRREETAARVRARLPDDAREEFERLYAPALSRYVIMEDHNVLIDQVVAALVQRACSALSRRLHAAGLTAGDHDGFFLAADELTTLDLERPDATLQGRLVERRRQWEVWCTYTPPVALGTRPAEVDEFSDQFIGRMYEPSGNPRLLSGTPCSPGVATGTARILRDMSEADRLGPGDILVCITTLPPWTPLFARAGGIVTVGGGLLSHAAITAREFGIPAVLSVADVTTLIGDGQRVTVDGTSGTVRIED